MKSITRITRRLMSVFLAFIATSMMFFSSPAVAATITTVNPDNIESEVLDSDKPVIVILVSQTFPEYIRQKLFKDVPAQFEKLYGDKYKFVTGAIEENNFLYRNILAPLIDPPLPGITAVVNGEPLRGIFINPNDTAPAIEYLKEQLDKA